MTATDDLLTSILAYCKRRRISPSTLGQNAVKNSKLVERLRSGGSVSLRTAERVRAYMDANPPEGDPTVAIAAEVEHRSAA